MKRIVATGIIFILAFSVFPIKGSNRIMENGVSNNGRTLYVGGTGPNNYTHIQDAINDAENGDTIFVYDDSSPYYENIVIDKSIKLIGENRETTIIDGRKKGYVVQIRAKNVIVSNFKIRNGGMGGFPEGGGIGIFSDNAKILNNIITKNGFYGMQIYSNNNLIEGNKIYSHAWWSLLFDKSSENVVRNNTLQFSKGGLYLMTGSNNNLIENNVMRSIEHAIDVYSKENNIIRNKIFDVSDGIIVSAVNNYIAYNNISNCCRSGMSIEGENNVIEGNILSRCKGGFYGGVALYSPSNIVRNNLFLKSGIIAYSYPNKVIDNIVNEKPLIYIENKRGEKIYGEAGQIIVVNSSYVRITNLSINNTCIGIQLLNSNHCFISNCSLQANGIGIKCNGSYNFFINNTIRKNGDYGIYCDGSFNHIEENKIILNGNGMYTTDNNIIRKNYIAYNEYDGLEISDKNIIENNTISSNGLSGILLCYSCNNLIKHNKFIDNIEGISIEDGCRNNVITNNEFINDGLWIHWWIMGNVGHNEIYDNTINGKPLIYMEEGTNEIVKEAGQVILIKCENISVKNQNISHVPIGIFLWKSKNCNISNNKISLCEIGVCISNSTENSIWDNSISSCDWEGISFYGSFSNIISKNFIESNFIGATIQSSGKNVFVYNFISRNEVAIFMEDSKFNKFYKNTFKNNGNATFLSMSNFNKFIENNFISNQKDVELYSFHNLWLRNYWDRWHIFLPKPIVGHLGRMPRIPWINFDWMPRIMP